MRGKVDEYRSGRWRVRFPWQGETHQLYSMEVRGEWIPFTSREMAEFLRQVLSRECTNPGFDIQDFKSIRDKTFWFEQAVDSWVKASTCSLDTLGSRTRYAETLFKPYFKDRDIRQITTSHIKDFHIWVKGVKSKKGKPYSSKTVKNILNELKGCFIYHSDAIGRMPKFPEIQVQDPVIHWLTEEQQDQVFEFIPVEHKPIFIFQRFTACRPNEARGLLKENVYRDKEYFVLATVYGYTGLKLNTKTKRVRPLPIIPELEDCLKPRDATRFVFSFKGEPYSKRTHEKIWATANSRANEKYGTPIVSMYPGTKHSFGCQRLNQGFTKDEIKTIMGHTDSKTTDRYAKYMTQTLAPVMRGKVRELKKAKGEAVADMLRSVDK